MHNWMYGLVQHQADGAGGSGGASTGSTPTTGIIPSTGVSGDKSTPPAAGEGADQTAKNDGTGQTVKTLDDLLKDETLSGDLNKRIANAVANAKQQWDADAVERERLAKLSAEDRAKEEAAKVERDRIAFEHDKQEFAAKQQLADAKLPTEFAKQLVGKDATETTANINTFAAAFKAAVEAGITERLKGTPPQAGIKPGEISSADAKYAKNPYYGKSI